MERWSDILARFSLTAWRCACQSRDNMRTRAASAVGSQAVEHRLRDETSQRKQYRPAELDLRHERWSGPDDWQA